MKTMLVIAATIALALTGCSRKPAPTFQVTEVHPCESVSVVGIYEGRELALSVDDKYFREGTVACPVEMGAEDVGRMLPASFNEAAGTISLQTPEWGRVDFVIEAARLRASR